MRRFLKGRLASGRESPWNSLVLTLLLLWGSVSFASEEFDSSPVLDAEIPNAMIVYRGWSFSSFLPLRFLARSAGDSVWWTLSGQAVSEQETQKVLGVSFDAQECFDGEVIIYDNLGTYVVSQDLTALYQACKDGKLHADAKGRYSAWITWDGRSVDREAVAPGVYSLRLLTWRSPEDGTKAKIYNQVFRFGWKRRL